MVVTKNMWILALNFVCFRSVIFHDSLKRQIVSNIRWDLGVTSIPGAANDTNL